MEIEKKVTCRNIEMMVMQTFKREKRCITVAPNLVLPHGWEADVAAITQTGFCHEFEIKTSRADFMADFRKVQGWKVFTNKHERMAAGKFDPKDCWMPNYFWFCTPRGMLKAEDIPAYAGWLEFEWYFMEAGMHHSYSFWRLHIYETKLAPRIHKVKVDNERLREAFLKRLTNIVAYGRGGEYDAVPDKVKTKVAVETQPSLFEGIN